MKLLKRNTTKFEYLPPTGNETDLNEYGEHTGDYRPEYGEPVTYIGNISAPSGQVQHQFFGMDIRYTHTLLMDDPKADIREHGLIHWNGLVLDIQAVCPSMNVLSIALKEQTGTVPEEQPAGEESGGEGE